MPIEDSRLVSEATLRLRDQYAALQAAVDPGNLAGGDEFYVLEFSDKKDGSEVSVVCSGVYHGKSSSEDYHVVSLDGETRQPRHYTSAQLDFYPPCSSPFVVVCSLDTVPYDRDDRSDNAQQDARDRQER